MKGKVLVVLTNTSKYPTLDRATGLWLSEAVHFVKELEDNNFEIDYVSPNGGYTPIDPHSLTAADKTDWQYYQNRNFMEKLGATLKPQQIKANDYDAIYYAGGHGVVWDFVDNKELQNISKHIYEHGGFVMGVCHGVVGLLNIKLSDGSLLIKGKEVTGFSNNEEHAVELDKVVPFLTQDALISKGAKYKKAHNLFEAFTIEDNRVITGQNPASSKDVAQLFLEKIWEVSLDKAA